MKSLKQMQDAVQDVTKSGPPPPTTTEVFVGGATNVSVWNTAGLIEVKTPEGFPRGWLLTAVEAKNLAAALMFHSQVKD